MRKRTLTTLALIILLFIGIYATIRLNTENGTTTPSTPAQTEPTAEELLPSEQLLPAEEQQPEEIETEAILPPPGFLPESVLLDAPLLAQLPELPTGCEITAATMLLNYAGINIDKIQLAQEIPYDDEDPTLGYVGDPESWDGLTIYPEALADTLRTYLPTAEAMTQKTLNSLRNKLAQGHPIVIWLAGLNGIYIHTVLLSGYDPHGFYYNDPWTEEKDAWISGSDLLEMWNGEENRALSY